MVVSYYIKAYWTIARSRSSFYRILSIRCGVSGRDYRYFFANRSGTAVSLNVVKVLQPGEEEQEWPA